MTMLLSERLALIVERTSSALMRERLEICREQAEVMEEKANSRQPWRSSDPETSHWDGDPESMSKLQRALLHVFQVTDRPLDEYKMTDAYVIIQTTNSEWMPHIDPGLQSTSLRKRRNDLEHLGLVRRLDSEGVSPIGRAIGRYVLTTAGSNA